MASTKPIAAPPEFIYDGATLYPKQRAAIFTPARIAVIEASSKSGKSGGCLVWLFEQAARGGAADDYWWVSPSHRQAYSIGYLGMKRALFLGGLRPDSGVYVANETRLTITLAHGPTIWFLTGEKPDLLYGAGVRAAVIDEASRFREEAWHAIQTTLAPTQGPVRIIGNVKGRQNWFYRLARTAEAGEPGMSYAKLTWRDAVEAHVLQQSYIDGARRSLPERVFQELYEAEPADDSARPFPPAQIQACLGPLSQEPAVCWGWDLGKSQDWTVGIALDADGRVCALERWQRPWEETIEWILGCSTDAPALVDSTGVGDPIVEALQRKSPGQFTGFHFSSASKQQLMEGLALAIQTRAIQFPDGVLAQELEGFEYEYTRHGVRYSAPEGLHDDTVCALALAVQHRRAARPVLEVW